MADNTQLNSGSAGDLIATDDIVGGVAAGAKAQRIKVGFGTDGSYADVEATVPLPVEISDGTDTALVTAAGAQLVDGSGVTQPVSGTDAENAVVSANPVLIGGRYDATPRLLGDGDAGAIALAPDGTVRVSDAAADGSRDLFSRGVVASAYNDIDIQFFKAAPSALLNVTTANSATAVANVGGALFSSSTNANGSVQGVTTEKTIYVSGSEVFCLFTAAFSAGIASSYMRLGLYDANEGFFLGYEGTSFGVTYRNNASDTTVAKGSFSEDTLTGAAGSQFTRAGSPEAIDLTKLNVFRIRFGWLGSAPLRWEVMAPDGHWVTFHKTLFPNLQATPSIRDPNLPITLDITKTAAAATDLTIQTDCWGAGTIAGPRNATRDEFAFQTTATLTNGSSYDSGVLALSPEFSQVQTTVNASHDGQITITWYSDAAGTDTVRTLVIPYTAADGFQLFAAPAFTPYNKYVFLNNSGSNQTDFHFDTKFMRRPLSPQILRVDGPVSDGMVASVQRSLITAYNGTAYTNVQATTSGNLKVSLQEASDGLDIGAGNAGSETLRVSVATDDVNLSSIAAGQLPDGHNVTVDNAAGASAVNIQDGGNKITVDWNGTDPPIGAGTEAGALRVTMATDSTGQMTVDGTVNIGTFPDNEPFNVAQWGGTAVVNGGTAGTAAIGGVLAHDAVDTGNKPVKVGANAVNFGATPTAVAAGDVTDLRATRYGTLLVLGGHMNIISREYFASTAQTNDAIVDTVAAGNRIIITMLSVSCDNANSADLGVRIGFGTASVPAKPADGASTTGVVWSHDGVPAGSGVVLGDGSGIVAIGASDEELRITTDAAQVVNVHVKYYVSAS